ncbi:VOC family protein [Thalassobacillus hwangdonensis]|uniref:VOC family protein n=1 Tax=Thalassobacillus hwangdonensis TaxID=546108 RepID=A0ABW3L1G8_9BACI
MFQIGSIFVPVTNLAKAKEWYTKHLGVKEIDSWEGGAGFYFPTGSVQLGLMEVSEPQPTDFNIGNGQKNSYYNFVVQDIHEAYDHFSQNDVPTSEIHEFGGMKFFDFFDPDGNPFSVVDEDLSSPFHKENVRKMQEKDQH